MGKAVGLGTSESGGRFPANEVQLEIQQSVVKKSLLHLLFVPYLKLQNNVSFQTCMAFESSLT